jgi:hypothetical protein
MEEGGGMTETWKDESYLASAAKGHPKPFPAKQEGGTIWPVADGGFCISYKDCWMPGSYETREAAEAAFQFSDAGLIKLQNAASPGRITLKMLEEEG